MGRHSHGSNVGMITSHGCVGTETMIDVTLVLLGT